MTSGRKRRERARSSGGVERTRCNATAVSIAQYQFAHCCAGGSAYTATPIAEYQFAHHRARGTAGPAISVAQYQFAHYRARGLTGCMHHTPRSWRPSRHQRLGLSRAQRSPHYRGDRRRRGGNQHNLAGSDAAGLCPGREVRPGGRREHTGFPAAGSGTTPYRRAARHHDTLVHGRHQPRATRRGHPAACAA